MTAYLSFLVYLLAILGFVALTLWLNRVLGPKPEPTPLKLEPFECGATPIETGQHAGGPGQVLRHRRRLHPVRPRNRLPLPVGAGGARRSPAFMLATFALFTLLLVLIMLYVWRTGLLEEVTTVSATQPVPRQAPSAAFEYLTTRKDEFVGWARKFSLFPYPFVTACCAMEFMSVSSTLYDTDRFGAALPRFTPRQSDLLMVVGTVIAQAGADPAQGLRADVRAQVGHRLRRLRDERRLLPELRRPAGHRQDHPGRPVHPGLPAAAGDGHRRHHEAAGHASRATATRSSTRSSERERGGQSARAGPRPASARRRSRPAWRTASLVLQIEPAQSRARGRPAQATSSASTCSST